MNYTKIIPLVAIVSALFCGCANNVTSQSQAMKLGLATLDGTQSYRLKAHGIDQVFDIDVAMPMQPVDKGKLLPVVYVLDGNGMFGTAEWASKIMQLGRDLPQMIVVGIGYHFDGIDGWNKQILIGDARMRDLTPSRDPHLKVGGGSTAFLGFLTAQVKPFIESNFPVDRTNQTIVGHSLSALFVLNTFLHSSDAFDRYVAGSPSLWWNEGEIMNDLRLGKTEGKSLYVSIGDQEGDAPPYRPTSNFEAFTTRLQSDAPPGLLLTVRSFAGETHVTSQSRAIVDGLRTVFPK